MTTKEILEKYYESLREKGKWESFFSDDLTFINNGKTMRGKEQALVGIKRFFSMVQSFEIKDMIVDSEKASTVVRYTLQIPNKEPFMGDIAEFFTLQNDECVHFAIYFDTAPYPPR